MKPVIHSLAFNDAQDCFACGLDTGLRVYNADPLVEKLNLSAKVVGGVKICTLLNRTNLIAVVGGGRFAKYNDNVVLVWDDARKQFIFEIEFAGPVLNVKMTYSR